MLNKHSTQSNKANQQKNIKKYVEKTKTYNLRSSGQSQHTLANKLEATFY